MNSWIGMIGSFPAAIAGNIHHMENTGKFTLLGIFSEKRQKYIVCFRQTEQLFDVLFQL